MTIDDFAKTVAARIGRDYHVLSRVSIEKRWNAWVVWVDGVPRGEFQTRRAAIRFVAALAAAIADSARPESPEKGGEP